MNDAIRVMVIPEMGAVEIRSIARRNVLRELQKLVGGRVESVPTYIDNTRLLVNEEGKLLGMRENRVATALLPYECDYIVGAAVLIGLVFEENEAVFDDLTNEQEAWSYAMRQIESGEEPEEEA